ncbi:hypothetical protein ACFUC1_01455 [Pedococcus sp. NPDC057267]|uniref:hypothetical protein n=1 Tax=Pedococcus sp. NPDC057267 TaxID=3346077 RepID=UPI0036258F53
MTRAAPAQATLLFASVGDDGGEDLRVVAATGTRVPPGWLRSASTRRDGLVQSADLTATVLSVVGAPVPNEVVGAPLATTAGLSGPRRAARLTDFERQAHATRAAVPWFFNAMVLAGTALSAYAWWTLREPRSSRCRRWLRWAALWLGAVPVSSFLVTLVPWWQAPAAPVVLAVLVASLAAALAGVAWFWPRPSSPMGSALVVAVVTMVVLGVDVVTGSRLQMASLMGVQPVVGGRFYGLGNTAFAVFAVATVVVCAAVAAGARRHPRLGVLCGVGVAAAAVVVDAAPGLGADGGGPLALAPGLGLCIVTAAGVRVTWSRVILLVGQGVVLVAAVAVADWARPPGKRTHLGRFVQSIMDGDAVQVVGRKAAANLALVPSFLTVLVVVAAVSVVWLTQAPQLERLRRALVADGRAPRAALVGAVVVLVVGMLVNDSGVAVGAAGAMVGLPLLVASFARADSDRMVCAPGGPS